MIIGGLQELTLIDYPGKLAATVFLAGCNFRCPWCYSSELVLPEKIKVQPEFTEKEIFDFLKQRKNLIEGVVLCGGEPTASKGLPSFIKKIKNEGFLVKLDTNGTNPKVIKNLADKKLVDYIAMDIKAPLGLKSEIRNPKSETNTKYKIQNTKYDTVTGTKVNLGNIKKSIDLIKNSGVDYEFRTTVVPFVHTKEDLLQMAKDISPAKKYYLQNFLPQKTLDTRFEAAKPYSPELLLEVQKAIAPFFEVCQVR